MGLKTTNYEMKYLGVTLPEVYARLTHLNIDIEGQAFGIFEIHQNRESFSQTRPLDIQHFNCRIDKNENIYEQMYINAKKQLFPNWEDDIVEEDYITFEDENKIEDA